MDSLTQSETQTPTSPSTSNQPTAVDPPPKAEVSFTWSDDRLLGFKPLDDIHKEFYATTLDLLICDESNLSSALAAFREHAERHFGEEDEWMRSTDFPPRECHIDEHSAVLDTVYQLQALAAEGRATPHLIHDFAMHLFEWFPGHATHLDSALAAWMCKRTLGGKPVVFKRGLG